jgi:hypothetical protein
MNYIKWFLFVSGFGVLTGCASNVCEPGVGYAMAGTNTAVIGISINKDGTPQESVKEVVVYPGQKVIYAGPDDFSIVFKDRKTPNGKIKNKSNDGVVSIKIPLDILDKKEYQKEYRENKFLTFDYSINVNGKEMDPPIKVYPR